MSLPGYYGTCCQYETYECDSSPCQNGGTCLDQVNAFSCECPPRLYGTYCETDICQPSVADIVFVLDSSISQTEDQFRQQLEFVERFIDHIVIGENDLQIGLVTFSTDAYVDVPLGEHQDNVTLKAAVRGVPYRPGATFTDKGLRLALAMFSSVLQTRPYGKVAKRFVFLLTDGLSTDKEETEAAALALKASVNRVLAIGIGQEVSHAELLQIASTDENNAGTFVHSVQNFNALYTIVQQLVHLTCDECSWKTSSNIAFLLDSSFSMAREDFQLGLDSMKYITEEIAAIESENKTVDLSLLLYGDKLEVKRNLNDQSSKEDFLYQLQALGLTDGSCNVDSGSCEDANLSVALNYTVQNMFPSNELSTLSGDKRDFIIVLTNGKQNVGETINEIDNAKDNGKTILVVSLATPENTENLQVLTGDPARVFTILDVESVHVLDVLVSEIFYNACELTNDFVNND